jgi:hypothetical protein
MAQASRKVIAPEVDSGEATLVTPRFDEAAAQQARPVVPLSNEGGYTPDGDMTVRSAQPSYLSARKGSWLLAAFVGLILGAGAMAVGIIAYKRNHAVSARSLVPATAATMPELDQDFRPRPSSRHSAPAPETVSSETKPSAGDTASNAMAATPATTATVATAPVPKRIKRRPVVTSASSENGSSEDGAAANDSSGKPKPRLVDRYTMPSSKP